MKCSIVGYGHVGKAMARLLPPAVVYDKPLKIGAKEMVSSTDACFVCVPTPAMDTAHVIRKLLRK